MRAIEAPVINANYIIDKNATIAIPVAIRL
jgi:hypothetical protein